MLPKDEWKTYRARWAEVEAVVARERRNASLLLRWRQLNSAYAMANSLGLLNKDASEVEVFERWTILKEKMPSQSLKA